MKRLAPLAGPALAALGATYAWLFLEAESQRELALLLAFAAAFAIVLGRTRVFAPVVRAASAHERLTFTSAAVALAVLVFVLREDDFALFLVARVLVLGVACLGLHVQFGYAGVVNFAGASFFGIGAYTCAVLVRSTGVPHLVAIVAGGIVAAVAGCVLLLPVLRTRGHYAALVTIAFALLLRSFLEVNDALGGPQGLKLPALRIGPWNLNDPIGTASFYVGYVAVALVLLAFAWLVVVRVERSWIGLALDAVRLDEIAAASFGLSIARWKITAFTLGNFLAGLAGAFSALMIGFIAPNNYSFGESLILVSILLLGGIGNPWGVALATAIVVLLPEKLQVIQEYRFLLYAALVIAILLFRPAGLVPRRLRSWPGAPT
jgi:ABC-type branched-subunit amino acid transport system permease subunit